MKYKYILSLVTKFYPLILILGIAGYGYWKIQSLESELDHKDNQLRQMIGQQEVLSERYEALGNEFEQFSTQVKEDLSDQVEVRQRINDLEREYQREFDELKNTFERDARGNPRDIDAIIDRRPTHLERLINDATRGIRDEFENIGR